MSSLQRYALLGRVGRYLRSNPRLQRVAYRCIPSLDWTIQLKPVGPFRINLRRNRSFWLRDPVSHDLFTLAALKRFCRPGTVAYDVGAHIGLYTRLLPELFGVSGVVAVEPSRVNLPLLTRNVHLGGLDDRVTVVEAALSDREGSEALQADDVSGQSGVLDRIAAGEPSEARRLFGLPAQMETVRTTTVDALVREQGLPAPDVMKIDVEGAAALVLAGARATLAERSVRIVLEIHSRRELRDVFNLLEPIGYHCAGRVPFEENGRRTFDHRLLTRGMVEAASVPQGFLVLMASPEPDELAENFGGSAAGDALSRLFASR